MKQKAKRVVRTEVYSLVLPWENTDEFLSKDKIKMAPEHYRVAEIKQ